MAINKTNQSTNNAGFSSNPAPVGSSGFSPESVVFDNTDMERKPNNQTYSWLGMNSLSSVNISNSANSLNLTRVEEAIKSVWKEGLNPEIQIDLIIMDNNSHKDLFVSCLVLCVRYSKDAKGPLAYFTFLLEDSIEPLTPRRVNVGRDRQVEVLQFVADAYDDVMRNAIRDEVHRRFPDREIYLDAYACPIPRGLDISDTNTIRSMTIEAVLACRKRMDETNRSVSDLNIAFAEDDARLIQNTTYGREHDLDYLGQPVRSDIQIDMFAQSVNQSNRGFGTPDRLITRVRGFLQLLWNSDVTPNPFMLQQPQQNLNKFYSPNFVITQLANDRIQTLPATLLGLINVYYLSEARNWIPALRPVRYSAKDQPLHDIGQIGNDIDLTGKGEYAPLETTKDKFDDNMLGNLVQALFHPQLSISMDTPICGVGSWQIRQFGQAALGSQKAQDEILTAANTLTNGVFSSHYQRLGGSGKPVMFFGDYIHLGHYQTKDGTLHDIRDADYLAACKIFGNNRALIDGWLQTFNGNMSIEERLDNRVRYLRDMFGGSIKFTGMAVRVVFENAFLEALTAAAAECRFVIYPQSPVMDNFSSQRPNAMGINQSQLIGSNTFVFGNNAFQGPRNFNAFGQGAFR